MKNDFHPKLLQGEAKERENFNTVGNEKQNRTGPCTKDVQEMLL